MGEKVKDVKEGVIRPVPAEKVTAQEGRKLNVNSCRDQWWSFS